MLLLTGRLIGFSQPLTTLALMSLMVSLIKQSMICASITVRRTRQTRTILRTLFQRIASDSEGTIQYIGRSINIKKRWNNHHRYTDLSTMGEIKIAYLRVEAKSGLAVLETALIAYFNPPLNASPQFALQTLIEEGFEPLEKWYQLLSSESASFLIQHATSKADFLPCLLER